MQKDSNFNDLLYWKDMVSGDEVAFSILFKKYYSSLYNFGKMYTSNSSLIADSIQDLFMDLWEKRSNLGSVYKVKSYLYGGFRNKLFKRFKKATKKSVFNNTTENNLDFGISLSVEDKIIKTENNKLKVRKVKSIINTLPPKQKEVIYLKYYKGFDNQQISEVLEINHQSVKNHLYRSSLIFKNQMKGLKK
jgi:RNA polymerase sigma factor (sigma-70 family)